MQNIKELAEKTFGVVCYFDFEGESIEAPLTYVHRNTLPLEVLSLEDDERCVYEDTFYQKHGGFFICYNQSKGWFALHLDD